MSSNFNYNYNNNSQNRYYNTVQPNQNYNFNQSSNNFAQPGMYNTNYNNYNNNYNNNYYDPNNNYNQNRNSAQYSNNNNNYFIPMEKNQRIKWKNVLRLDLNFIQQTNDLSMLEAYLENLIYSNINEDEISSVPEGNVAKLIKIYQFTIEYLLNSQTKLENQVNFLQEENSKNSNKIEMKDSKINEDKDTINRLKKQVERDRIVLLTYQNAIANLKRGRKTNINISLNESQNVLNEKNEEKDYYCKFCTGKKFYSKSELDRHLRKAHLIDQIPLKNEESKNNDFEKKLDEMKNQFQNYVQQFQTNSMMKYIENQRKMDEEQHEKQLEKLEKSFKDTLIDLKDFYIQNMNKNPQSTNLYIPQPQIIEKSEKIEKIEKNNENNELTNELQKQLSLMNQILENLRKENEMRLKNLQDNFQEEIEKLRNEQNQQNQDLKTSINVNLSSKEIPKKETILRISQDKGQEFILQPQKKEKIKPKKEKFFASDVIESDHDDSDEEYEKDQKTIKQLKNYTEELVNITNKTTKIIYKNEEQKPKEKKKDENEIIINKGTTNLIPNNIKESFSQKNDEVQSEKSIPLRAQNKKIFFKTENLNKKNPIFDFYKIYKHRENKIFENPNEENFNEDVLPKDFPKNIDLMKNSININFNQTTKNISKNHDYDLDNFDEKIKDKSEKELLDLIDKTLKNIKDLNSENKILNEYYNTIQNYLDLQLIPKEMENILSKSMILPEKNINIVSERFDENISEANKNFNSQSMNKIPTGKKSEHSQDIKSKKSDKKSQKNSINNNSNQIEEVDINVDNNVNNNFEDQPKIIEKKNNLEIPNENNEQSSNINNNISNNANNNNDNNNDNNNNNNNDNNNNNNDNNNNNNNNNDIYESQNESINNKKNNLEEEPNLKKSLIFNNEQKQDLNYDEENNIQENIKNDEEPIKEEEEKKQNNNIVVSSWDKKSNE